MLFLLFLKISFFCAKIKTKAMIKRILLLTSICFFSTTTIAQEEKIPKQSDEFSKQSIINSIEKFNNGENEFEISYSGIDFNKEEKIAEIHNVSFFNKEGTIKYPIKIDSVVMSDPNNKEHAKISINNFQSVEKELIEFQQYKEPQNKEGHLFLKALSDYNPGDTFTGNISFTGSSINNKTLVVTDINIDNILSSEFFLQTSGQNISVDNIKTINAKEITINKFSFSYDNKFPMGLMKTSITPNKEKEILEIKPKELAINILKAMKQNKRFSFEVNLVEPVSVPSIINVVFASMGDPENAESIIRSVIKLNFETKVY